MIQLYHSAVAKKRGSASSAPTIVYKASYTDTSDLTVYTFSSADIGSAASRDHVLVCVAGRSSTTGLDVSSVTVNGVSMTLIGETLSDDSGKSTYNGWWGGVVPTVSTADVVVTFAAGAVRAAVDVFTSENLASLTPSATVHLDQWNTSDAKSLNTSTPSGDSIIVGSVVRGTSCTITWTGLTEKSDYVVESFMLVSTATGQFSSSGTQSITEQPSGTYIKDNGITLCLQ